MTTIILAAGLSTRMGRNKLVLPFQDTSVLATTIRKAKLVSDKVLVVSGYERERTELIAKEEGVEVVYNPNYQQGQKTSTLRGIGAVEEDDFAILPGDLPLIGEEDLKKVFQALKEGSIARGVYQGIPGHPVAFRKENRNRLLAYSGSMKDYLKEIGFLKIPTSIGSVFDLDSPDRYHALLDCNGDFSILDSHLN